MIKFGIVGAGMISQEHANALSKIKDVQIVAIVDKLEDRGKKWLKT